MEPIKNINHSTKDRYWKYRGRKFHNPTYAKSHDTEFSDLLAASLENSKKPIAVVDQIREERNKHENVDD